MSLDLQPIIERARDANVRTRVTAIRQLRSLKEQGVDLPPSALTVLEQWDRQQQEAMDKLRKTPAYGADEITYFDHAEPVQDHWTQAEKDLQVGVVQYLESLGACVDQNYVGSKRGGAVWKTKGTPDLYVALSGKTLWIELKTATGKLSDTQKDWHERFKAQGVQVVVCRSIYEVQEALREAGMI